ncbi:MAG: ArsA family ATPase [Victivallaceae bacterium]|nr:ArsA family ATPase [Victivallaceae bacterium]
MKLTLFGGKGGVGKTTCAAAAGLRSAQNQCPTLVICTDPAHSLADSLDQTVGGEIKPVKDVENLSAIEVNSEKALEAFKTLHEAEIKNILDTSTHLDDEDIDSMFQLPIPGMDELMGFKTIVDLIDEGKFERYIVDTAPTGHALRLLNSPYLIDDWIKVMAKMRWKYRYMVQSFAGKYTPDKSDDFLMSLKKTVKRIEKMLRNDLESEFIVVTIPEPMAILETERLLLELDEFGIAAKRLIVNSVLESDGCEFCRERRKTQQEHIGRLKQRFGNLTIMPVPLQAKPVVGMAALNRIMDYLPD